ncbi:MAG: sigma 54-interacting transcriptional regulator [Planctomycetota bacterium]
MGTPNKRSAIAYLVIRDGKKWSDVFRLMPGRTVTIGRSPTSQIVVKEEQASRKHAEIFQVQGKWTVRDLKSRNGTAVGEERVVGDRQLEPGDVIWIANTQLAFVNDLSSAYNRKVFSKVEIGNETITGLEVDDDQATLTELPIEPTTITHRRQKTKFTSAEVEEDEEIIEPIPKVGIAATKLCRLAFDLANETSVRGIARMALDSMVDGTRVDAGAVLMVPIKKPATTNPEKLEIIAWRSENKPEYQRVSKFLAETVLRDGEAVLARDIQDDSALGLRDSKGEIWAKSVICAPIKMNTRMLGLIHLYSTRAEDLLDPDDLEFTLAVAETVGLAMRTRYREQKLVEDLHKTRDEINQLREQLGVASEIIGGSGAMLKVHQQIAKAGPSRATVLINGESGVGKELVARAVHYSSPRKGGPFVCLNCAALSESLLESELFGHEKGAFTNATDRKIGKFEAAHKGTMMLDEIGEMSPTIQAKFLRVLEGHAFERVGGNRPIKTDVRVIAATNRDLEEDVRNGTFRKDLFFRLNVVTIKVPPLRHRAEDVLELAEHFMQKFNVETNRKITGFSPAARQQLVRYRWPGNVRELRNVIERAVVLARTDLIEVDELTLTNLATASESNMEYDAMASVYQPQSLEQIEQQHIEATLTATGWNKSKSAAILGIERSTLDRKIKKYGILKQ